MYRTGKRLDSEKPVKKNIIRMMGPELRQRTSVRWKGKKQNPIQGMRKRSELRTE